MKSKESIKKKWDLKVSEMKRKADLKFSILLANRKKTIEKYWDYEVEKNEKKKAAYIKKKEAEYKRRCLNEIREFENKPKRVYKSEWPKIKPLEFAMELAQENSRLRDTDKSGWWRCISCNKLCEWWELAWWHRYSRKFTNMCLVEENINAQCHTCNFTTWPRWNVEAKERTNQMYDKNLVKKYWPDVLDKLSKLVYEFFHNKSNKYSLYNINKEYDLALIVPRLIKTNEKLWKEKNFQKPKRNRRKTRDEYIKRH